MSITDMLYNLKNFLDYRSPKIFPIWTQYLNSLNYQKNELQRRYINNYGTDNKCVQILKHILSFVDIPYLQTQRNDFDRYLYNLKNFKNVFNEVFDPIKNGRSYRNIFYKKTFYDTYEYICPVEDVDHIKILPLDRSWKDCIKIKPVTIWYHDSYEYSLNFLQDQLIFKFEQPKHSVIFIDPISMAFKYYKYMVTNLPDEPEKTLHTFIHRHVLSLLFEDFQNIWLLSQIDFIVNRIYYANTSTDLQNIILKLTDTYFPSDRQYGYKTGRYTEALTELANGLFLIKLGAIQPESILSSTLFTNGSILDRINYGFEYLDTPHLSQYKYMEFIKDFALLKIIIRIFSYQTDHQRARNIYRDLKIYLNRMLLEKPWNRISDPYIKNKFSSDLYNLYNSLLIEDFTDLSTY